MMFLAIEPTPPTIEEWVLWAIIASPLVAFGLIALYIRNIPKLAGYLAILAIGISGVLAYWTLFNVIDADGGVAVYAYDWWSAGGLEVNIGVRVDGLQSR